MSSRLFAATAVIGLLSGSPLAEPVAAALEDQAQTRPLKAIIHINFGDPNQQEGGLRNIEAILAEVGDANVTLEVVCHSDGIGLVVVGQSPYAEKIRAIQARGVHFVACRNTMRRKGIQPEQLLEGVEIVPSGALEVVRKQQDGYSYFRP